MFTPEEITILENIIKSKMAKEITKVMDIAKRYECNDEELEWCPDTSKMGTDPAIIYENNERLAILSDEAHEIITIISSGSKALNSQGRVTKSSLRTYLINMCKWENHLIDKVYEELTQFCRSS